MRIDYTLRVCIIKICKICKTILKYTLQIISRKLCEEMEENLVSSKIRIFLSSFWDYTY